MKIKRFWHGMNCQAINQKLTVERFIDELVDCLIEGDNDGLAMLLQHLTIRCNYFRSHTFSKVIFWLLHAVSMLVNSLPLIPASLSFPSCPYPPGIAKCLHSLPEFKCSLGYSARKNKFSLFFILLTNWKAYRSLLRFSCGPSIKYVWLTQFYSFS